MPMKSKSRITTKSRSTFAKSEQPASSRRLPTHRPPTHPGEMLLEEFLKPLGISQSSFAIRLGISFPRLNEIVRSKRGVTSDTALRLARYFGTTAELWAGLQADYDLRLARYEKAQQIEREIGAADNVPAIKGVAIDLSGRVWVGRFSFPDEAPRTDVFSPDGNYLGTFTGLTVPLGFPSRDLLVTPVVDSTTDIARVEVARFKPRGPR